MSFLDSFLYKNIAALGNLLTTQRSTLNFKGSGVSVADNPTTKQTDVTISGGSASFGKFNLPLINGNNSNVVNDGSLLQVIGGPTAQFTLGSVAPSVSLTSGQPVVFENSTSQIWFLKHLDPSATGGSLQFSIPGQIVAGATVLVFGKVSAHYDGTNLVVDLGTQYKRLFNVREFGAVGDGTHDDTVPIQNTINAAQSAGAGSVVFFPVPSISYKITAPLLVTTKGLRLLGDGTPLTGGVAISAIFPVLSGTHGVIVSATISNPASGGDNFASFTAASDGASPFASANQGDSLIIVDGTNPTNNAAFTIVVQSSTELWFGAYANAASNTAGSNVPVPTSGLTWSIKRPMFQVYTQDVIFEGLSLLGNGTVGAVIDSTAYGTTGLTSGITTPCTGNQFVDCNVTGGYFGVKIGDVSGFVSGATLAGGFQYPANCDLHVFRRCFIHDNTKNVAIVSSTAQSKSHLFDRCYLQTAVYAAGTYGIYARAGSFFLDTCVFSQNQYDICVQAVSDVLNFVNCTSENSARLLYVNLGAGAPFLVNFYGGRFDQNPTYALGGGSPFNYVQNEKAGTVAFHGTTFGAASCFFAVQANTLPTNPRALSYFFDVCTMTSQTSVSLASAVANLVQTNAAASQNGYWKTLGSQILIPNGLGGYTANDIPDDDYQALNNANVWYRPRQIGLLLQPNVSITWNGSATIPNPYATAVTVTGPTGSATLSSIGAGFDGQRLRLRLSYNQQTTVSHAAAVTSGTKIFVPTGASYVIAAPGAAAGGFQPCVFVDLSYDSTLDSSNGGWLVVS